MVKMPSNKSSTDDEDQVIQIIGTFGKWQAMLIFPLGLHFIFGSFQTLVTPFMSIKPDYHCKIEAPKDIFDSYDERWRNFSNPYNETLETFDLCNIYDIDYSLINKMAVESGKTAKNYSQGDITMKKCTEFVFNTTVNSETEMSSIVTDFDLVCGNDWRITLAQVVYMFGILVGASTSGMVSDKFGRKKTIIFFSTAMSAFSIAVAFANCYDFFVFLRWGLAFSSVGFWTTFYVYAMEMVGGKWKTLFGIGFEYPWALAYSTLPGIAYTVRNWSHLQLIISVPPVIFLVIYHFIPESPRWLLSQGRVEEAKIILEKAGKTNGRQWPENLVLEGKSKDPEAGSGATILDLFKTPNLRKNTLIQYFNWFTASFVYYALTFDSGSLIPGDIYLNNLVSGLIEFPAYTICIPLLYYLGRRISLSFMYNLLGISLLISLAETDPKWVLAWASLGKFGAICAFAIIYVQAVEIFPTVLRNSGIGSSSSMARVGSILAPVVGRELTKINRSLTIVIFSVVALMAGTFTLFLPETNKKILPDTIEEGEAFGKGENAFTKMARGNSLNKETTTKNGHSQNDDIGMQNQGFSKE